MRNDLIDRCHEAPDRIVPTSRGDGLWTGVKFFKFECDTDIAIMDPYLPSASPLDLPLCQPGFWKILLFSVEVSGCGNGCAFLEIRPLGADSRFDVPWRQATRGGEPAMLLVDHGLGAVCDARTASRLSPSKNPKAFDRFTTQVECVYKPTKLKSGRGAVIAFRSGFGDGAYPIWWKLNDGGDKVMDLAIDFDVLRFD